MLKHLILFLLGLGVLTWSLGAESPLLVLDGEHSLTLQGPLTVTDSFVPGADPVFSNNLQVKVDSGNLTYLGTLALVGNPLVDQNLAISESETWLQWDVNQFRLRGGYLVHQWGSADELNPSDVLNARDLTKPYYANNKIPALSLGVEWFPTEELALEAVILPFFQKNKLPAWAMAQLGDLVPQEILPENSLESSSLASRARWFSPFGDLSISYVLGWDPMPSPRVSLLEKDISALYAAPLGSMMVMVPSALDLVYHRQHYLGLDYKNSVEGWTYWFEAGASLSPDLSMTAVDIRNPFLDGVAGLERSFGPDNDWTINLQYRFSHSLGYDPQQLDAYDTGSLSYINQPLDFYRNHAYALLTNPLGGIDAQWEQSASLFLTLPLNAGQFIPELMVLGQLPGPHHEDPYKRLGGMLASASFTIKVQDEFSIKLGGYFARAWKQKSGEAVVLDYESPLGSQSKYNSVFLEFSYSWIKTIADSEGDQ